MRYLWITLCILMASPAVAACVTSDDLHGGIVIKSGNPNMPIVLTQRDLGNGLVWRGQHSAIFPDQWHIFAHAGLFDIYKQRASGSGQQFRTHAVSLADLPPITAGTSFETAVSWGRPDRSRVWTIDNALFSVTQRPPVQVGLCRYDAVTVQIKGLLTHPDGKQKRYQNTSTYLPDLKLDLTNLSDIYEIRQATFRDAVISDRALRKLAAKVPEVANALSAYGLTP